MNLELYQSSTTCSSSTFVETVIAFYLFWTFLPVNFSCHDKTSPVECLAGTYAAAGSIQCQSCPKGAHCPNNGLSMYVLCANGTYSDVEGRSNCKSCDVGFKCPSVGMEAPEVCPNGTYSYAIGARYCILCPEGYRWDFVTFHSVS